MSFWKVRLPKRAYYFAFVFFFSTAALATTVRREFPSVGPSCDGVAAAAADTFSFRAPNMVQIQQQIIPRFARTLEPVLILGETGTGKEVTARAIHEKSVRHGRPFHVVHIAALSPQLLERELFGNEKGAFTGADQRRPGHFEQAEGGTLFLDEIGELSLETQTKLLRFLQDHSYSRVGGVEVLHADVRIIAATNRDLEESVNAGKFREDLYHRLNVLDVTLPPLRERRTDLKSLLEYFARKIGAEHGETYKYFSSGALARLLAYSWPGNIRELENAVKRAVIMSSPAQMMRVCDLPERIQRATDDLPPTIARRSNVTTDLDLDWALTEKLAEIVHGALRTHRGDLTATAAALKIPRAKLELLLYDLGIEYRNDDEGTILKFNHAKGISTAWVSGITGSGHDDLNLETAFSALEKRLILSALERSQNSLVEASALLGISRGSLQSKMRKYGIEISP